MGIPEEGTKGLVEDAGTVILGVLLQQQVPKPIADLVPALPDLDGHELSWHVNIIEFE